MKNTAKLVAKWEKRLRSEGLPAELPASRRQSLHDINERWSSDDSSTSNRDRYQVPNGHGLESSSIFQHWTLLTHAVHALPENYKGRAFLVAYADTGYMQRACDATGLTIMKGRTIVAKFVKYVKLRETHNDES